MAFAFFLDWTLGSVCIELEPRELALFIAANPTRRGSEVSVLVLDALTSVTSVVTLPLSGLPSTPVNACIAELELDVTASEAETMGESDNAALDEQILDVPENGFPFLIFLFRLLKIRRQSDSTNSPLSFPTVTKLNRLGKTGLGLGFPQKDFIEFSIMNFNPLVAIFVRTSTVIDNMVRMSCHR